MELNNLQNQQGSDILRFIISSGMIDIGDVQNSMEAMKRKELLEKHPYKIWQGKDGKWRTYLPDKNQRKMIKKNRREDLEKEVAEHWRAETENPTVREVFDEWNDRRLELKKISDATHLRNRQIFNRHYAYHDFGEKRIKNMEPEDFEEFLEEQIPIHNLTAKAFSNLKTVTRGFLKRAKKRKLIGFNVEELLQEIDASDADFKKVIKEDCQEVFDECELPRIMEHLKNNLDIRNLGILLMFLTGIRVGELVVLKHGDFTGTAFKIRRTETRYLVEEGHYAYEVKDFPKSEAGVRTAIIPNGYAWVAEKLKLQNPFGEYIFTENGERLKTNSIRRRMVRVCKNLGIVPKSPHKARKTYGTILLDNNIDQRLITELMGHTNISCTENHYHRNRKSMERKSDLISGIPELQAK